MLLLHHYYDYLLVFFSGAVIIASMLLTVGEQTRDLVRAAAIRRTERYEKLTMPTVGFATVVRISHCFQPPTCSCHEI